jgi:hypothetical protein
MCDLLLAFFLFSTFSIGMTIVYTLVILRKSKYSDLTKTEKLKFWLILFWPTYPFLIVGWSIYHILGFFFSSPNP